MERAVESTVDILNVDSDCGLELPVLEEKLQAGFPSPLHGMVRETIDLNRELINHPATTFCGRVKGSSMVDAGIFDNDILIIDKSLEPNDGDIAVCFVDGEFTLKRIAIRRDGVYLVPSNPAFDEIRVDSESNFQVWGVVTFVIHSVK